MQSTNKVLCNFDQQLTELEKYTARANLGTFGLYEIQASSTTHTIDQTEASDGQFVFSRTGVSGPGVFLLSILFYISPYGTKPNENVIPLWVSVRRNKTGGAHNDVVGYTVDLTRLEQNGPWQGRLDIFQTVTEKLENMEFFVDFEPYKIPQNTPVECRVSGVLIGNIELTP